MTRALLAEDGVGVSTDPSRNRRIIDWSEMIAIVDTRLLMGSMYVNACGVSVSAESLTAQPTIMSTTRKKNLNSPLS